MTTVALPAVGALAKVAITTGEATVTIEPGAESGLVQLVSTIGWSYRSSPTAGGIPVLGVAADQPLTLPVNAPLTFYVTGSGSGTLNILRVM